MTTDIIEINNFIVLREQSNSEKTIVQTCVIDGDAVGFAFYSSGEVELEIKHQKQTKIVTNTRGTAISFFGINRVEFSHKIGHNKPLAKFKKPVLILWGEDDPELFPIELGRRLESIFQNSTFIEIKNSRTYIQEDNPIDFVQQILQFTG